MPAVDVLVIGSGLAGLATALYLADAGIETAIVTKTASPEESNTRHAQGGIIYSGAEDSPEPLIADIEQAGCGLCYPPAVRLLAEEGPQVVRELLIEAARVPFTAEKGELHLTAEGGHHARRIIHKDDRTGSQLVDSLLALAKTRPKIRFLTNRTAVDLITRAHNSRDLMARYKKPECFGAYLLDSETRLVETWLARAVVLATGGLGQIYLHTTNPDLATGDGFAMARRAGAVLINMEYTQFHPTTLYHERADRFLISEAVRGEGAVLVTRDGREFMHRYHEQGSLAPRDVVTRGILEELVERNERFVYLDLSPIGKKEIARRFPAIHARCREYGIDITREPIPVVPAFHFSCGGIRVNENARSNLLRLYAVGEVSCTGVHGANRLASTSLLECVVWGKRCAADIRERWAELDAEVYPPVADWVDTGLERDFDPALTAQDWATLRHIMWNYVGPVRTTHRLIRACEDLLNLKDDVEGFYRDTVLSRSLVELRNAAAVGLIIAEAAWQNRVSLGCHYRKA